MSNTELLVEEIKTLPDDYAAEVLDFVGYLKEKAAKRRHAGGGACPLCAQYYDPKTGDPPYNAETRAAIEEGDAMLRGEIPANRFHTLEEMLADIRS